MTDEAREKLEQKFDEEAGYHICGATAVEDQLSRGEKSAINQFSCIGKDLFGQLKLFGDHHAVLGKSNIETNS